MRFLGIVLFGLVSVGALAASGVAVWVLYGSPAEPRRSNADPLGSQFEARRGEALAPVGPLKAGENSPREVAGGTAAPARPVAEVQFPLPAFSGGSGSSTPDAAGPEKNSRQITDHRAGADRPQLARTEPQDRRPAARTQGMISRSLVESPPRRQCSIDVCTATYASFHAADCTYQPHGGGPRQICKLSTGSGDAATQTSRAAADSRTEARRTRAAERDDEMPISTTPARAGGQCHIDLCAETYASFHAADCSYQPRGGGPRQICQQ